MDQFHIGSWQDYSQPAGDRGRFTMSKNNGNVFLSFLTVMVTVAGASAWTIVSIIIHSWIVRARQNNDVFDVQQQILLRNAKTPLATVAEFFKLWRAWRKKKVPNVALRTLWVLIPTLLLYGGILVASIFASKVAINKDGGGIALARDQGCGILPLSGTYPDIEQDMIRKNKIVNDTIDGRNYAINFYDVDSTTRSKSVRSTFITDALPYSANFNASCPFQNQTLCLTGATISFESGELNSHSEFGINAKEHDRISTRAKTTCTMVNLNGYWNASNNQVYIWMGQSGTGNWGYTYRYNLALTNFSIGYQIVDFTDSSFYSNDSVLWNRYDEFAVEDGDLTLLLNSQNWMRYSAPVNDPFFLANIRDPSASSKYPYKPNYSMVPMVCVDSYMICNPDKEKCSPWARYEDFYTTVFNDTNNDMGFNDAQLATAARMAIHMQQTNINTIVSNLGSASLFASDHVYRNHESTGLPDNQWHIEATTWFQTKLAKFQASVAEYVSKPDDAVGLPVLKPNDPNTKNEYEVSDEILKKLQDQCNSQLIMGTADIESFSLAGTLVIVIITVFLAIVSIYITEIMDFFGRFVPGSKGHLARVSDEKLHVLKHALSVQDGPQKWDIRAGVPVTEDSHGGQWPKTDVQTTHVQMTDVQTTYPSAEERLMSKQYPEFR
ncbi:unnamed protein product [Clonostachys solani]|uniref:Uncharacterized protein n=1 Tax=Clonostachys solani TaxID=160281 RepID=A0A9N9ZLR2_9HYPO|nr:unnamed protein product [Clonostachys solani]